MLLPEELLAVTVSILLTVGEKSKSITVNQTVEKKINVGDMALDSIWTGDCWPGRGVLSSAHQN